MTEKTKNFTIMLMALIIIILLIRGCGKGDTEVVEKEVVVEVPVPITKHTSDTIYKPYPVKERITDTVEIEKYIYASGAEKEDMYIEATKERDYKEVFKDTFQDITVNSKVKGKLIAQNIKYETKPYNLKIDTVIKFKKEKPKFAKFYGGVEARLGVLNDKPNKVVIKPGIDFVIRDDFILKGSVDTEGYLWIGTYFKIR